MQFMDKFLRFIAENSLFTKEQPILLAVSGGKDSVLMAYLFAEAGFNFGIAHCNFGLREEASNLDEEFVKSLADQFKVDFYSTHFSTEQYASENHISIQMAARDLRYKWLEEIRSKHNYSFLAVAHHQTDSVETVFLNLLRGTGIAGLSGILPKRDKLIRPLLAFTGEEVKDIVVQKKLDFREDASNASTKYKRNRIRLEVLPVLRKINPEIEKTFLANSKRFHAVESFLTQAVEELRLELFIKEPNEETHIQISHLKELNPISLWIYELFSPYGFTEAVLSDLLRDWDNGSGRSFYSSTHQILVDRTSLILKPLVKENFEDLSIEALPYEFTWFHKRYKVYSADRADLSLTGFIQVIDFDAVKLPLLVRSWHQGDRFQPLGMKGQKKVSDFLISLKIPVTLKQEVPVIEDAGQSIVAILPWRIDDNFKVTPKTKKVIIFDEIKDE
ncbi:tRNA(Ile)-lysidine synthase [Albibacterium bauzanense]|uniref:tRNA(Ile)-lysidine synthase n=2 Tax=Albibacterium bauzanense TaxID=653929 RepID=A0A4R1LZW4_9SPHI|nr:tRNA(Ile)-lysidine synthase [Albibacterium bauzanense]